MTAGIIVMAAMMGAMFLFGGHGKGHKHGGHTEHASTEITVSTSAATAIPAAPAEVAKDTEHRH